MLITHAYEFNKIELTVLHVYHLEVRINGQNSINISNHIERLSNKESRQINKITFNSKQANFKNSHSHLLSLYLSSREPKLPK